jgi:hypothetical protein
VFLNLVRIYIYSPPFLTNIQYATNNYVTNLAAVTCFDGKDRD